MEGKTMTLDSLFSVAISIGIPSIIAIAGYAVTRSKVDQHHQMLYDQNGVSLVSKVNQHHLVLFDERGVLTFSSKQDCKDKHAEDLTRLCLKLTNVQTEIAGLKELVTTLLNRMQKEDGLRSYDPRNSHSTLPEPPHNQGGMFG